jgi:hypothetical protein
MALSSIGTTTLHRLSAGTLVRVVYALNHNARVQMWTSLLLRHVILQLPRHLTMKTDVSVILFHSRASAVQSYFRSAGCESSGPKSISMNPHLRLTIDAARGRFPNPRNLKIANLVFATYMYAYMSRVHQRFDPYNLEAPGHVASLSRISLFWFRHKRFL